MSFLRTPSAIKAEQDLLGYALTEWAKAKEGYKTAAKYHQATKSSEMADRTDNATPNQEQVLASSSASPIGREHTLIVTPPDRPAPAHVPKPKDLMSDNRWKLA